MLVLAASLSLGRGKGDRAVEGLEHKDPMDCPVIRATTADLWS